jgi:hypothetical protein
VAGPDRDPDRSSLPTTDSSASKKRLGVSLLPLALLTAYAADELTGANIVDGSLTGKDLFDNTIGTADVTKNSLSGADVDESTLNLAAEPWHEVGSSGEPQFHTTASCSWSNLDGNRNSAAFLRDRSGFVHLKGVVDADDVTTCKPGTSDDGIFTLAPGYRAARFEAFATQVSGGNPGIIKVNGSTGAVAVGGIIQDAKSSLSADGISFRCAPSGQNGCP